MRVRHDTCKGSGMEQRSRYASALSEAERTLGGRKRLAEFLGVAPERIERWLAGQEVPPLEIFLNTLDLIADVPCAPARPMKVAVIRP